MALGSIILDCISIGISISALLISIKRYRIDKSILRARISNISADGLTTMYPSMEDDDSKYKVEILIVNSGYREELITNIILIYDNSSSMIEIFKSIPSKNQQQFEFELRRIEIIGLRKIKIIPAEDRPVLIGKKELSLWQHKVTRHIDKIQGVWKNGQRIEG